MNMGEELLTMVQGMQQVGISASQLAKQQFAREVLALIESDVKQRMEFDQIIHHVIQKCGEPFHG